MLGVTDCKQCLVLTETKMLCFCVILELGDEGAQAKDSQPQGNLDALLCYSRSGK